VESALRVLQFVVRDRGHPRRRGDARFCAAADHSGGRKEGFDLASYDLYLWAEPDPVTAEQAWGICNRLADGDEDSTMPAAGHPEFAAELVTHYPLGLGRRAGAPEDRYSLEHRDGSAERHYRVFIDNLDEAVVAFHGFAGHDAAWKAAHSWTR
jgi:hypothetical protein